MTVNKEYHIIIQNLVSQGKLKEAIFSFLTKRRNKVSMFISYQFNEINRLFSLGLITIENYIIIKNRLALTLLSEVENDKASSGNLKKISS